MNITKSTFSFCIHSKVVVFFLSHLFSAERAAVAAGGVPRTNPEDVHGLGAHPDETGLQHEVGYRTPQA